jgi:hypothetical protein
LNSHKLIEERWAPADGDQLAAAAGALLNGKTLIIGAGRSIAARTCLLHDAAANITVIELHEEFRKYAPDVKWFTMDVHNFYPSEEYENLFVDTYPPLENLHVLRRLAKCVVEAGKIICLAEYYRPADFGPEWEVELKIAPSRLVSNVVQRLRRKNLGSRSG